MKTMNTILLLVFVIGVSVLAFNACAQTEIQQQLDSVSSTVSDVNAQVASIKEKGFVQTIWDNVTAPIMAIWQQIVAIFAQIMGIFSFGSK